MSCWNRFFLVKRWGTSDKFSFIFQKKKLDNSFVCAFAKPHNGLFNPLWNSGFCYSTGVSWPGRNPLKAADISCGKQKKIWILQNLTYCGTYRPNNTSAVPSSGSSFLAWFRKEASATGVSDWWRSGRNREQILTKQRRLGTRSR